MAEILAPSVADGATRCPGLVLFLGALLTAVLALVVWIELILREAAIYVTVALPADRARGRGVATDLALGATAG